MRKLGEQIRDLRESVRAVLDPEASDEDKFIEIGNSLFEIADTFEMLQERFESLSR